MKLTAKDLGASISPQVGLGAQSASEAASYSLVGSAIDRRDSATNGLPMSAVLIVSTGAATGSPSAMAVDVRVAESETAGGTYTAIEDTDITQITNLTTGTETVKFELESRQRFLKVQATVAFTGGTDPEVPICAVLVLGGYSVEPTTLA